MKNSDVLFFRPYLIRFHYFVRRITFQLCFPRTVCIFPFSSLVASEWVGAICFGVDRFHIVACQHDVLGQTASFELTQIAGNLHILIQALVDCKNGQCIVFLIPDADRIEIRSFAVRFALVNRCQNLCI